MPSATTADSSDSIAQSMAIVKAGPTSSMTRAAVISGTCTAGRPDGTPPKAVPMVATPGSWKTLCRTAANTSAASGPGTRRRPGTRLP